MFAKFGSIGVVAVEGDADPGKLDPDPAFVVIEGRLYMPHSVILFDLVYRKLRLIFSHFLPIPNNIIIQNLKISLILFSITTSIMIIMMIIFIFLHIFL